MVAPGRESQLINALFEIANTLVKDFDVAELLHNLVGHCVDLLDLEAAGLMLVDTFGNLHVVASSTERIRLLELFQLETNSGPCVECIRSGEPVSAPDLAAIPDRWPLFVERARRDGYAAAHALPMRLRGQVVGAINLFTAAPGELPIDDLRLAQVLADTATIGVLHDRALEHCSSMAEQLQGALNGRVVIEQAKGLVAEAGALDMDEAFARLRMFARGTSTRLADVARQLVDGNLSALSLVDNSPVIPGAPSRPRPSTARPSPTPGRSSRPSPAPGRSAGPSGAGDNSDT